MTETISLEVLRYSPERDAEPSFQRYDVPLRKDWVVLDALNYIKDKVDGSLTFRWSCRMGICGSCGMMVNGEPKLTCATFLADYAPAPVRVEPLRYFPIVRDLVIEMTDFLRKLRAMKPWIIRKEEKSLPEGEYLQTPQQLDSYKQYSMCINCMLCYAACPVYGLDPLFSGPAAIALAQRYNLDSRFHVLVAWPMDVFEIRLTGADQHFRRFFRADHAVAAPRAAPWTTGLRGFSEVVEEPGRHRTECHQLLLCRVSHC